MAMASVAMSDSVIEPHIKEAMARVSRGPITIACINSANNVTVAGESSGVDTLVSMVEEMGVFARRLPVNVAYHSPYIRHSEDEYLQLISCLSPRSSSDLNSGSQPSIFSCVTGNQLSIEDFGRPAYWARNLASKVMFYDALTQMSSYLLTLGVPHGSSKHILIEIGPTAALQRPVKDTIDSVVPWKGILYDSALRRGESSLENCLELMGRLICSGYRPDVTRMNFPKLEKQDLMVLTNLPEYPFNHKQSYWTESRVSRNFRMRQHARHELLGTPSADWNEFEPRWRNIIRTKENPWIVDHKVGWNQILILGL